MPRQFILPDLGEGISEAQIVRVLIKQGDKVALDQYLMEVETDKAAVEIPSPYAGVAKQVHVKEGQTVNVGTVIVTFDDSDSAPIAKSPPKAAAAFASSAPLSPKAAAASAPPPPATPQPRKTVAAGPPPPPPPRRG